MRPAPTLRSALAPIILFALSLVMVASAALGLRSAASEASSARRAHTQRLADAGRIIQLRTQEQTALDRKRPESDVLRLVTTALSEAGVETSPQLAPGGSTAVLNGQGSARLMRQSVTVTLAGLSPRQIGAFLSAFESAPGPWRIADIALTANAQTTSARTSEADPPYTARLTLAAIYVSDQP